MNLSTVCSALLCALTLLWPAQPASAQNPERAVALLGVAYDSLSGKPLVAATLRIIGRDGTVQSDTKGRFRFDSLTVGTYMVVMEHPRLDSVGLNEIARRATIPSGRREVNVTIAIPSFSTLWRGVCGNADIPSDAGIVYGAIREPARQQGVRGAQIAISWMDVGVSDAKKLKQTRFTLDTESDSTGAYVACGVPVDVPLEVVARADSGSAGAASEILIDLPAQNSRVIRRDLMLGLSALTGLSDSLAALGPLGGKGLVRGKVVNGTGEPIGNVRVGIDGVELTRTNDAGAYVANGVRAGTRTVAFVSIGSEPVTRIVDVPVDGTVTASASMTRVTVLENLVVRGTRISRLLSNFEARKRAGFGSIKDSTELIRYPSIESALRMSRGVTIDGRSHAIFLRSITGPRNPSGVCSPTIFLDGRMVDSEQLLSYFPSDIAWLEVYPRWYDVPFEFQVNDRMCGVIAIFTKYGIGSR